MFGILRRIQSIVNRGLQAVGSAISRVTKPMAHGPWLCPVTDLARSKPQLVAENLLLHQQLIALHRSVKRPRFTPTEHGLLVLLASKLQHWTDALLIVKPRPCCAGIARASGYSGSGERACDRMRRRYQLRP